MKNFSFFDIVLAPLGVANRKPIKGKKCPFCGEKRLVWWEQSTQKYCVGIECLNTECEAFCVGIAPTYDVILEKIYNPDSSVRFASNETGRALFNRNRKEKCENVED